MKKRIIGAIFILSVLISSIILGNNVFRIVMTLCALGSFYELFSIKYKNKSNKLGIISMLGYLLILLIMFNNTLYYFNYGILLILVFFCFIIPIVFINDKNRYNINDALYLIGIVIFISSAMASIVYFRNQDIYKGLFVFVLSFATDVYAYIGGSLIGRHHFTSISPKKTVEGCLIGVVMGSLIGAVYYYNVIGNIDIFLVILLSICLSILSEIGDLVFSSIKRYFDVKDYSNLIPGHGGLLDRLDSVIFVSLGLLLFLNII